MKNVAGLMCLGSLYAGALWTEYQIALLLGIGCLFFFGGSALTLVAAALYRAPEGCERSDGLHITRRDRRPNLVRHTRFAQPARAGQ
jgi:hypothetical protein